MLNPALDLPDLSARFARSGRLQIEAVLHPEAAAALHDCLAHAVPWNMAYLDAQGQPTTLTPEQRTALGPAECTRIRAEVARRARQGYQFLYHAYHMVSAYKAGRDPHLPLGRVLEFLNSPEFLGPLRTITGAEDVVRADAQATCYVPGDFLRWHTDHDEHMGRRVAYVLGLSHDWQADWGGLLQFLGPDGAVTETLMPRFNTLSIFRVPTPHCVSMVAPWATTPRLSITGWLMRAEAQ
jgi:Rps23 Pro-64 3,4-dihydroxylase Tpa1-like proline 4-hydroxylase